MGFHGEEPFKEGSAKRRKKSGGSAPKGVETLVFQERGIPTLKTQPADTILVMFMNGKGETHREATFIGPSTRRRGGERAKIDGGCCGRWMAGNVPRPGRQPLGRRS